MTNKKTIAAFGREAAHKQAVQWAIRIIKRGRDTLEEIAEILNLPLEEVIALNKEIKILSV